jgi:hypothetical protein
MTVQFRRIEGFDRLPAEHAQNIIYKDLLPACENAGILLSRYGNLACEGAPEPDQKYRPLKESRELFNIARVQQAYQAIVVFEANKSMPGFCSLKEKVNNQVEGITTGDLVVALLLRGHIANFHSPKTMECDVKWVKP